MSSLTPQTVGSTLEKSRDHYIQWLLSPYSVFSPDGSYLTGKAGLCLKYVYFIYTYTLNGDTKYQLLPAPSPCSTQTEVLQLNISVYYNNKVKYNNSLLSSDYIQRLPSKQKYPELKKSTSKPNFKKKKYFLRSYVCNYTQTLMALK